MAITLKSAEVMFFLALVAPPIKGVTRVRKVDKTKFGTQHDTLWSIYALNQTYFSSLYMDKDEEMPNLIVLLSEAC